MSELETRTLAEDELSELLDAADDHWVTRLTRCHYWP